MDQGDINRIAGMVLALLLAAAPAGARAEEGVIRAGIVGCDTSHVIAFTNLINDPKASGALANVRVTIAYPGGSPDIPASRDRMPAYVAQLRTKGITIVDSLEALIDECDAVLLESVDGRPHWEQFRAIARGKPVFIDKPAAGSLADVLRIFRHAEATKTPVFTSSSLRFVDDMQAIKADESLGELLGCETTGPLSFEPHHPDLFWYGIHGVEPLYAILGRGCESVSRTDTKSSTLVVGKWSDGRIGSYRGITAGHAKYAVTAYGTKNLVHRAGFSGYEPAVRTICEFFASGEPPVASEETIEIFAFMEAADESKRRGGAPVSVAEILQRAEQQVAADELQTGK